MTAIWIGYCLLVSALLGLAALLAERALGHYRKPVRAVWAAAVGPVILTALWLEQRRLARGWTYEPPTFYETNKPLADAGRSRSPVPAQARWVEPSVVPEDQARTA